MGWMTKTSKAVRGLFEGVFGKDRTPKETSFFQTLTAYRPAFTTWGGELYESELVRSAIDAKARNISKLAPTFNGTAKSYLKVLTRTSPNPWMSWGQFLYRVETILEMQCTAFIVPILEDGERLTGYFPVLPSRCDVVEDENGQAWLRYNFSTGKKAAMELNRCGILTKFQYKDDLFGTSNNALIPTMQLLDIQRQGVQESVKNSATFRFMARVNNFSRAEDLAKERKRFDQTNLQGESGGLLLFPNTYADIQQIQSKPYSVDAEQIKIIQTNVFNYFGVNEDVLQNKCYGDAWNAFYEGAIEPFAVQLGDVMTRMTYSSREIGTGNSVFFTSNRLQYMSNADKLNVSKELADRGLIMLDEAREIWNLPPLPDGEGQRFIIRGEYHDAFEHLNEGGENNADENGGTGIPGDDGNAGAAE